MPLEELDIYFDDLTKDCQERILKHFKIKDPKEANWDVVPITSIPCDKLEE